MIGEFPDAKMELRAASPSSRNFSESILASTKNGRLRSLEAFSREAQRERLRRTLSNEPPDPGIHQRTIRTVPNRSMRFERTGNLPKGFERIIQQHFERRPVGKNEVILNQHHKNRAQGVGAGPQRPHGQCVARPRFGGTHKSWRKT